MKHKGISNLLRDLKSGQVLSMKEYTVLLKEIELTHFLYEEEIKLNEKELKRKPWSDDIKKEILNGVTVLHCIMYKSLYDPQTDLGEKLKDLPPTIFFFVHKD